MQYSPMLSAFHQACMHTLHICSWSVDEKQVYQTVFTL